MKLTKQTRIMLVALAAGAILTGEIRADDRPTMHAVRVADGAITVDGRADDWSFAYPAEGYVMSAAGLTHLNPHFMRGKWTGPEDLSYHAMAAVDSKYLYIIAFVRDSLLFNGGDQEEPHAPWRGDDFEVYVDANPSEGRFGKKLNENCAQAVLVPEHLWATSKGTPIWTSHDLPGIRAASRLTPTGYVIEAAIPKEDFPNWKAHPDLDSIGFDMLAADLDTPGVIGHDPGEKQMMFLLDADPHFQTPAKLGVLQFDAGKAAHGDKPEGNDESLPGYAAAQSILDHWDAAGIEAKANAALTGPALARKAALLLFMQRPDLSPDIGAMVAVLKEPTGSASQAPLLDGRAYAMMALAERHKLPAAEIFDTYAQSDDDLLRAAFFYSLGINGDKSIVPQLAKVYPTIKGKGNSNNMQLVNMQLVVAFSLGQLGDATGAPALAGAVTYDFGPQQPYGRKCAALLKSLGITPPPTPVWNPNH